MPQLQTFFEEFLPAFNEELDAYLKEQIRNLRELDPLGDQMARVIARFVSEGGKRIRPALTVLGHEVAGRTDRARILAAAVSVELFHAYFLIHDDVMDKSDTRRGKPTVHKMFEQRLVKRFKGDQSGRGEALAILAGDACCAFAYRALLTSDFSAESVLRALLRMQEIADITLVGQTLDVYLSLDSDASEQLIKKLQQFKTAEYTFVGPLQVGMILAGESDDMVAAIKKYARPVGVAFQIMDDYLGVFGTEKALGKSVTSDLAEGKQTLLTAYVFNYGTCEQRGRLRTLLGRPLSPSELEEARNIFRDSGAAAASEQFAEQLVRKGQEALRALSFPKPVSSVLHELADYVIRRDK